MQAMKRSLLLAAAGALAIVLAAPAATALARRHIVQPGDPGSTQYQEDVPTAQGSRPVTTLHAGPTTPPSASATIPAATVHSLTRHGAAGRAALSLAEQTAPPPSPSRNGPGSTGQSHPNLHYRATAAAGVIAQSLLGERGGMGVFLPIIIGLALGSTITLTIVRRRR